MMKTYFVYILKCSDDSYYVGFTNNLERRIAEHQEGDAPKSYTFNKRPVQLVYYTDFFDPNQAIEFEKQLKGWTRKKKEALITKNWEKLKEYSKCNNKSSHQIYRDKK